MTTLGRERVHFDSRRALVWPAEGAVIVADTHFGKDSGLRRLGSPVPEGSTEADLNVLTHLLEDHQASRLWILGDVFDSDAASESCTIERLREWRGLHRHREIAMVPGNHDRSALALAAEAGFAVLPDEAPAGPFLLAHHPGKTSRNFRLCGHLHPGALFRGPGRERIVLPCFWLSGNQLVLPAFGALTGLARVKPGPHDRVWVIAADAVLGPFPAPEKNPPVSPARRSRDLD